MRLVAARALGYWSGGRERLAGKVFVVAFGRGEGVGLVVFGRVGGFGRLIGHAR
jgi:hypothetical protein